MTRGAAAAVALTLALAACGRAEKPPGQAVSFADLPGFADDDHVAALATFRVSCRAPKSTHPAAAAPEALNAVCREASTLPEAIDDAAARRFVEAHFTPRRIDGPAFLTGYYEPVIEGVLKKSDAFPTPLYGPPASLVGGAPDQTFPGVDPSLNAALKKPDGTFAALPDRAAIEAGALDARPIAFVRDPVEAFFIQVQGSARIALPDGTLKRLVYAGRNGYPYTSIGKILVAEQHIPPAQMGMTQLKAWIRDHGQRPGEAGRLLMDRNRSYIFFAVDDALPATAGPIGASGISLTALRSLAVDRTRWAYGLPMYVDATLPWTGDQPAPFRRLMVAQDTGAAITGEARADIFFGTGAEAAKRAGAIRNTGTLFVLWPKAAP